MAKLQNPDLDQFIAYVNRKPSLLGCWRDGAPGRLPTLAWLNTEPVVRFRALAREIGPQAAAGVQTSAHHNQVGIAAGWVTKYMTGSAGRRVTPHQDRVALFNTAALHWALTNAIVEIRCGVRGYEVTGTLVRLPYAGNHHLDALDRLLDVVRMLEQLSIERPIPNDELARWARSEGKVTTWEDSPAWVQDGYRTQAIAVLAQYSPHLAGSVDVGGFTIADYDRFWVELMARASHAYAATLVGSTKPDVVMPWFHRDEFVDQMATAASLEVSVATAITEVLTVDLDRCPDGSLTPIVPVDSLVVPMSGLIIPGSPHRNLLAILQAEPGRFGDAGRLLGLAGEQETFATLERMADHVLLGRRIRVTRVDGNSAGDLDIVVCDPTTRSLVILEIKWHLAADGNAEVYKAEAKAIEKRQQVIRLRREVEDGTATVEWPAAWPDVAGWAKRWYVLTRDVLVTRHIDDDDITIRSQQLLSHTLPAGASAVDLIDKLDNPPIPPEELAATEWNRVRYGDLRVEIETIVA